MNFYKNASLKSLRTEAIQSLVQLSYEEDAAKNSHSVSILETTKSQLTVSLFDQNSANKKDYSLLNNYPLSCSELEIIFGICETQPKTATQCRGLINDVIKPYFTNISRQLFSEAAMNKFYPSKAVSDEGHSVYELLSFKLSKFLISSHGRFVELRSLVETIFANFFNSLNSKFITNDVFVVLGIFTAAADTSYVSNIHETLVTCGWKFLSLYDSKLKVVVENDIGNELLSSYHEHHCEVGSFLFLEKLAKVQYKVVNELFIDDKNEASFVENMLALKRETEVHPSLVKAKYEDKLEIFDKNHVFLTYILYQSLEKLQLFQSFPVDVSSFQSINSYFLIQDILLQTCSLSLISYSEKIVSAAVEVLKEFIKNYTIDTFLPSDDYLSTVVSFACLLNYYSETITSELVSFFPVLISNKFASASFVERVSKIFSNGLPALTEDTVVGSVYDISNLLGDGRDKYLQKRKMTLTSTLGQEISTSMKNENGIVLREQKSKFFKLLTKQKDIGVTSQASIAASHGSLLSSNKPPHDSKDASLDEEEIQLEKVVVSMVSIAANYKDNSVSGLILTILIQKYNSINSKLDRIILRNLASLTLVMEKNEFNLIVKFLQSLDAKVDTVEQQRLLLETKLHISRTLRESVEHKQSVYNEYLNFLLESIASIGSEKTNKKCDLNKDDENIYSLAEHLLVLSEMLPTDPSKIIALNEHYSALLRDVWINLATHGFYYDYKKKLVINCNNSSAILNTNSLSIIALNTPSLAAYTPGSTLETSYKLNSVLHRKVSSKIIAVQEKSIKTNFGVSSSLNKVEVLFLTAVTLLESQRLVIAPEIAIKSTLLYKYDDSIKNDFGNFFENFAKKMCHTICSSKRFRTFLPLERYSAILNSLLILICSRDKDVQKSAYSVADKLIGYLPEALNVKKSIFLCLDLLAILYQSYYDVSKNKYQLLVDYEVDSENIVSLPLSEHWRKDTLSYYEQHCSSWFDILLSRTPDITKATLHQYVATKSKTNYKKLNRFNYGVSFARSKANSLNGGEFDPETFLNQQVDHSLLTNNSTWTSLDTTIEFFTASSLNQMHPGNLIWTEYCLLKNRLLGDQLESSEVNLSHETVPTFLNLCSKLVYESKENNLSCNTAGILSDLITVSFFKGTGSDNLLYGITVWKKLISYQPELSGLFLAELTKIWENHINQPDFILNSNNGIISCEEDIMEYTPSDTPAVIEIATSLLEESRGYLQLFSFIEELAIKTLQFTEYCSLSDSFIQFIQVTLNSFESNSALNIHPSLKFLKLRLFKVFYKLIECCFKRIAKTSTETLLTGKNIGFLVNKITTYCLKMFSGKSLWPFGNDALEWDQLYYSLRSIYKLLVVKDFHSHSDYFKFLQASCGDEIKILQMFLAHELYTISIWQESFIGAQYSNSSSLSLPKLDAATVKACFEIDIRLAANLIDRYLGEGGVGSNLNKDRTQMWKVFGDLINENPIRAAKFYGHGLKFLNEVNLIKYGTLFDKIDPMSTINYLLPVSEYSKFVKSPKTLPIILQYFMKSLESYSSQVTFFYIPQIVQCLRYDNNGYVERFILDSGMINSYFAHQIIWNMKANKFKDENLTEIDPVLGPKLYTITDLLEKSFDKEALAFYHKEFSFFTEVTNISGTLKDYIKYSKPEKKQVIDREMAKIKVAPGVYLPSNPDGVVVDIDRKSGKPLQSHAKAPFMATFKIAKKAADGTPVTKLQSAIFKVGDDCRQDVLALQLINCCKNIWLEVGLDVYVFPYRVTATDGGCGVIDVLPHSISRDMLGREAVNGLYEWFVSKFGNENSTAFEAARLNFIKSLAGYSVISYLLQFKDRHNGNIMYDDFGHILHIDFGFIFDIVPGGVKFEAVPFKLTKEMIRVLGGSKDALGFKLFERLTVKAFLALRKHYKFLQNTIEPMLDSNLPCFKGKTIKHLQNRMALDKTELEASQFMKAKIARSYESTFTKGYDEFQRLTNGIPY